MKEIKILLIICMLLISLNFISAVSIKDISSYPNEIAPGQVAEVQIKIENVFEYDISNLNIKLDLSEAPFAPYQSSSEKYLDELESEKEKIFRFDIIALPETPSGIYKIPVQISYSDDEGINQTKREIVSLIINSKPELKVSLEDSITLVKGQENEISIRIINSGLADVKFVYLTIGDTTGIKILSEKEQYIGDIDTDDFDNVKYNSYISKTASSIIGLPVILKYKDATNKEFTETKTLSLRTYSLKEARDLGLVVKPTYTFYIIGGIVIIGYFIYRYRKKRKLRKLKEGR